MTPSSELVERLLTLADAEFERAKAEVSRIEHPWPVWFLIEACRVLDYHHVIHFMSGKPELGLSEFDFFLMVRGWNPFVGLVLPHVRDTGGIPAVESTPETRGHVLSILINLGKTTLLRENAEMVRHGMAEGDMARDSISLRMSERCRLDHFLDRLEKDKLDRLEEGMPGDDLFKAAIERTSITDLDERIRSLVHPWRLNEKVTMVGYNAEPDIDAHYFALVVKDAVTSAADAGIHSRTIVGGVSGENLNLIVFLITSFYLKHIRFVDVAKRMYPEVNYPMSLTIWNLKSELIESISSFTGLAKATVTKAIDLVTVKAGHESYFQSEITAFIPMLIEVTNNYLLSPVSSVFRNPVPRIRMLYESRNSEGQVAIREHREQWMISDLYHLFHGTRYSCMNGPTKLRRNKQVITDIDAAVFDHTTGDLALFQLKWQDFNSNDVAKQRSRAKNFVEQIDSWAQCVDGWISEFGTDGLLQILRIKASAQVRISKVHYFAIGRSAARFRSYGYTLATDGIAACTWRQFMRLRYVTGPSDCVLGDLHAAIKREQLTHIRLTPIRQEITLGGTKVIFENLWNQFDDESSDIHQPSTAG